MPKLLTSYCSEELKRAQHKEGQSMGGDTMTDDETKGQPESQGSSSEPEWGRNTKPDQEKELKQWQETNIGPNNRDKYRFGHCHLCNVPIATTSSPNTLTFTCFECRQEEQYDVRAEVRSSTGKGKMNVMMKKSFTEFQSRESGTATMTKHYPTC